MRVVRGGYRCKVGLLLVATFSEALLNGDGRTALNSDVFTYSTDSFEPKVVYGNLGV